MQTITGVLTREPEIRYTPQGVAMTTIQILRADNGEGLEVTCTGSLAENVALSLTKGHWVTVVGGVPPTAFRATEVAVSLRRATVEVGRITNHWGDDDEDSLEPWVKETN